MLADPKSGDGALHSVEFCGGTHVKNSRDIGDFAIVSEEAIKKGQRRVVCISGNVATHAIVIADALDKEIEGGVSDILGMLNKINGSTIPASRKNDMREKLDVLKKIKLEEAKVLLAGFTAAAVVASEQIIAEQPKLWVNTVDAGAHAKAMSGGIQKVKKASPETVVMFFSVHEGVAACMALVPKKIGKETGLNAKEWLDAVVAVIGGKSGGSAEIAQCRGDAVDKVAEAIEVAKAFAATKLP